MALEYPLDNQSRGTIESTDFEKIKSLKFYGGLPIFTAVPTYVGKDGEIVLYQNTGSSDYRLYAFLDGAWKKIGDVDFTTGSGYLQNVVEDTTPQLGGDLDVNDKAIVGKSNSIRRYTIQKTLSDNTSTSVFTISCSGTNSVYIRFTFLICVTGSGANNGAIGGTETIVCAFVPGSSHSGSKTLREEEIAASGTMDTTGLIDWILEDDTLTFKIGVNNSFNLSMTLSAVVEVLGQNSNYTFTAL